MIEIGIEFSSADQKLVNKALMSLPRELRPVIYKIGEDEIGKKIEDQNDFVGYLNKRESGVFLIAENAAYDVDYIPGANINISCFAKNGAVFVEELLTHMSAANPLFGFACAVEERERWNRIATTFGVNSLESWVGRDIERYIPGLYWITLINTDLASMHRFDLSKAADSALEYRMTGERQHFFRFYDRPSDWHSDRAIQTLRSNSNGLFDANIVRRLLPEAENFLEIHSILRKWS